MFKALTIAGSDSSGGAGVQADLKTMLANGVYGMSAFAALTAQNTTGVRSIYPVSPEFLADQIDMVFEDIRPDAVKIGMVSSKPLIETIAERLKFHQAENIVLDPVMAATSGSLLIEQDAIETLQSQLFPLASLITPNIPESEILCGFSITSQTEMEKAARAIYDRWNTPVLVKGGMRFMRPMICFLMVKPCTGLKAAGLILTTPMERAARFRVRLLPIWQKDTVWNNPFSGPKRIFLGHWKPDWIWEDRMDQLIMALN